MALGVQLIGWQAYAHDRQAARVYADKYASTLGDDSGYNTEFFINWNLNNQGGDCANFISQSLIAADVDFSAMDHTAYPVDVKGSIINVRRLAPALQNNLGARIVDYNDASLPTNIPAGTPFFLLDGSPLVDYFRDSHAMLIAGANQTGIFEQTYDGHNENRNHYPTIKIGLREAWVLYSQKLQVYNLSTMPIVKLVELTQTVDGEERIIHRWKYDSDYDPESTSAEYFRNTYNGLTPESLAISDNPNIAGSGELRLKIIFDTTMRQNTFAVKFGKNAPDYDEHQFETVEWRATHQFSDTWIGRVTIPKNDPSYSGTHHLKIHAEGPDGSLLDDNSNLASYVPADDSAHGFKLDATAPYTTAQDSRGAIQQDGATNGQGISITADDRGGGGGAAAPVVSGLAKIEIFNGDPAAGGTLLASNSDPYPAAHTYTKDDPGLSILGQLPEGKIFARVTDKSANDTSVMFNVGSGGTGDEDVLSKYPSVSIVGVAASLSNIRGTSNLNPSGLAFPQGVAVTIEDPVGLKSVTITQTNSGGVGGTEFFNRQYSVADQKLNLGVQLGDGAPPPGQYVVTATNQDDLKTVAQFRIVELEISADLASSKTTLIPERGTFGSFQGELQFDLKGTLPLHSLRILDVNFNVVETRVEPAPEIKIPAASETELHLPQSRYLALADKEGNQVIMPIGHGTSLASMNVLPGFAPTLPEFDSGVMDIRDLPVNIVGTSFLPGSVLVGAGPGIEDTGREITGSLPLGPHTAPIGTFEILLKTGPDAVSLESQVAASGEVSDVPPEGSISGAPVSFPLGRYMQLKSTTQKRPPQVIGNCMSFIAISETEVACGRWTELIPAVNLGNVYGQWAYFGSTTPLESVTFFPGTAQTVPIGVDAEIRGVNISTKGVIGFAFSGSGPPLPVEFEGYRPIFSMVMAGDPITDGSFRVEVPASLENLSEGQVENLKLIRLVSAGAIEVPGGASLTAQGRLGFTTDRFGTYVFITPVFTTPVAKKLDELDFFSDKDVIIEHADPAALTDALAQLAADGKAQVTDPYHVGPTGTQFPTPGVVRMEVPPAYANDPSLTAVQYTQGGSYEKLPGFRTDGVTASARVSSLSSNFALFVDTVPVLLPDLAGPRSALSFLGHVDLDTMTSVAAVLTTTQLRLGANDPAVPRRLTSGAATTYYTIDDDSLLLSTAAALVYAAPFSLSTGAHAVRYRSVDLAGNLEAANVALLAVILPDRTPPVTTLGATGTVSQNPDGSFSIQPDTSLTLAALDPVVPGAYRSGVAQTRYLVDQAFMSTTTTPGQAYAGPISLPAGSHSLWFYSSDAAGNYEAARGVMVTVISSNTQPASAPRDLVVKAVSDTQIALAWSGGGNQPGTGYTAFAAAIASTSDCSFSTASAFRQNSSTTSVVLSGAPADTAFGLLVCLTAQQGLCSNLVTVRTRPVGSGILNDPQFNSCSGGGSGGGGSGGGSTGTVTSGSGLAVAADAAGKLWIVAEQNGQIFLARHGAGGLEGKVTLPGAVNDGAWTIRFDAAGNPLAVGAAAAPGGGQDLAVYSLVAGASGVTLASTTYRSPDGARVQPWDASPEMWITGVIGSISEGAGSLRLGLWKYAAGALTLTSAYSRGGPVDGGFGVRALGDAVFVLGYTSTETLATPNLGRALWRFDAQGHGPTAETIAPGVLRKLGGAVAARLETAGGSLYAAFERTSGGFNGLGFAKLSPAGATALERLLTFPGLDLTPRALTLDAQGRLAVAAAAQGSAGGGMGMARYGLDAAYLGTTGDTTLQGRAARGVAAYGQDLVMAVDGSTAPHRFLGDAPLQGTDLVLVSSAPPVVVDTFTATLALSPQTLNLKSEGKTVTAELRLSGAKAAGDVDAAVVRLTAVNDLAVSPLSPQKTSLEGDVLTLKFDRQALIALLVPQEQAKLTVTGRLLDGGSWAASALIRTISPTTVQANEAAAVVQPAYGASVTLPAGALGAAADITLTSLAGLPEEERGRKADAARTLGLEPRGKAFDFGPEGTQFALPVTLTIPYDADTLGGADPARLRVAYWNPASSTWEPLLSHVDQARRVVTAQTTHFSQYQVLAPPGPGLGAAAVPSAAGADEFRPLDLYAFPNPARRATPTIRAQFGLADSVELRFHDVSGRLVHSATLRGPQLVDDGNGKGAQWSFDYLWNVDGVGSGVYLYTATARKTGQPDLRKSGRVAVVK